jgi:hypothetical protein
MRYVRFAGLRSYLERLLDDVALGAAGQGVRGEAVGALIHRTAERLNHVIEQKDFGPDDLQPESRELLGWFRYFSSPANFQQYTQAVERILTVFPPSAQKVRATRPAWRLPLLVHFRPTSSLYRWRITAEGTRVTLPTPMIVLSREQMGALSAQIGGQRTDCVSEMLLTPEYRRVAAALAAAGGIADRATGKAHDLAASFERVNEEYFAGSFDRPRLTWSTRDSLRKFGHYDFVQDLVMLSRTLDAEHVPSYVIDHVMHHELLHKKHGFRFVAGRRHAHLPAFRREERTFRHYTEADQFLESLSRSLRCSRC